MKTGNRANYRRSVRLSRWARLAVAAATMALLLTSVGGAAAASKERTGDRIDLLFDTPKTYPANTAFHIWHGFIFENGDGGRGQFEFQLEVDGVPATADFVDLEILDLGLSKVWVFNFPDGLSGTHTFTAHWISPDGDDSLEETVRFVR